MPVHPPDTLTNLIPATWRWHSPTRYYVAHLERDLLGDWVLSCCWGGRDNRRGGHQHWAVTTRAAAEAKVRALDRIRRRHGYVPVAECR